MKKGQILALIGTTIIVIIVIIILVKMGSRKKRIRTVKDFYKDESLYIWQEPSTASKYHYFDKTARAVILANAEDMKKTDGWLKIEAVIANDNGKNQTRKFKGWHIQAADLK